MILFINQNKLLQLYYLNTVFSYPKHDSFFGHVTTYFSVFSGLSGTFLACYNMNIQYHVQMICNHITQTIDDISTSHSTSHVHWLFC